MGKNLSRDGKKMKVWLKQLQLEESIEVFNLLQKTVVEGSGGVQLCILN
ncbi:hypothetical protein NRK67_12525 [Fusobacteria bacterium ZRK30]|nr:hypothetical protein NRK67_12525 [Fusobacteria bacterium ZRK30]